MKDMITSRLRDKNMCVKRMGQSNGMRIVSLKEKSIMSRSEVSGDGVKDKSMGDMKKVCKWLWVREVSMRLGVRKMSMRWRMRK